MDAAAPTIHPLATDDEAADAAALVERLTSVDDGSGGVGLQVLVHVADSGNRAWATIRDERSSGHGSQRWLQHARRGSSPGGWSQQHHPRAERRVGAWKEANASTLDRLLIDRSKAAWRLAEQPPCVVEFAVVGLAECGIVEPDDASA